MELHKARLVPDFGNITRTRQVNGEFADDLRAWAG
jgi:hypothetical protein